MLDLTGRVLRTASFSGGTYALDLTGWTPGVYFLRVQTGATTAVQRLVVER